MKRLGGTPAWVWMLVFGVPVALSYPWLAYGTWPASLCFEGIGVVSCVVMLVAIRRRRPQRPLMWYLLLAGMALSVTGDAVYDYLENVAHIDPYPGWADLFYLSAYPVSIAGLGTMVLRRTRGRDRVGMIDAWILSTALALPAWSFWVRPISMGDHAGLADQLVSLAYPVLDVLLITLTVRSATTPGALRLRTNQLLVLAQVTRLLPDVTYSIAQLAGVEIGYLDSGWLLTYLLTAAAALHPRMADVDKPATGDEVTLTMPRLTLLTVASLLAPAILAAQGVFQHGRVDWAAVAIGSAVLFLLVVARMKLLLDQMHRLARQMQGLAHHDGLTGVPNRRAWDDRLNRELAKARRAGHPVVVGMIDLDFFKKFNDEYGHPAGDLLLKEAAAAWTGQLRDEDLLARYGGEEFGIVLAGRDVDEATAIVERLRAVSPRGQTFSAGLAVFDGSESADELVSRADRALYRAKATGRDRTVCDDPQALTDEVSIAV
ncbi:diguanylate cyclase (GGDEF)-like protein [Actinoplanes tereljensis]